ncbi:MAG: hypothetical protein IK121_09080, partial [Lachnospiraceae bacterium]|nr:hypothetical protein [Lachnospiraceae bacterium]
MAVVLTILKIIGIVLLCVITLALFLIALVLFVPIRYRISAKRSDAKSDPTAGIRATYLLHILCAGFVYDKETDRYVKVFGIRLKKKDKDKSSDKEKKHKKRNKEEKHDKEDKESYTIDWNEREEEHDTGHETVHEAEHKDDVKEESMSSLARFIESIVSKYESLSDDAERLKKNIRFCDRMAHDERNLAAFELIKIQVVKFLKRIAPRSVKGYVHFG